MTLIPGRRVGDWAPAIRLLAVPSRIQDVVLVAAQKIALTDNSVTHVWSTSKPFGCGHFVAERPHFGSTHSFFFCGNKVQRLWSYYWGTGGEMRCCQLVSFWSSEGEGACMKKPHYNTCKVLNFSWPSCCIWVHMMPTCQSISIILYPVQQYLLVSVDLSSCDLGTLACLL